MAVAAQQSEDSEPLYDTETGRFDGARLRQAFFQRGLTVLLAVEESGVTESTAYRAIRGEPVNTSTAMALLRMLNKHEPLQVL